MQKVVDEIPKTILFYPQAFKATFNDRLNLRHFLFEFLFIKKS